MTDKIDPWKNVPDLELSLNVAGQLGSDQPIPYELLKELPLQPWEEALNEGADIENVVAPKTILDEASDIVSGARRKAYGHPENNFGRIAALWNAYLNGKAEGPLPITSTDVSLLMILMKVARLIETPTHRDSLVDLAGYAATIEMLWQND